MEKQKDIPRPADKKSNTNLKTNSTQSPVEDIYPEKIPESQGDLADRAEIEIEQEIEEQIFRVRQRLKENEKN